MTDIVMTKETKPKNPILKKYVSFYEHERFRVKVVTNLQAIGMQGYERYTRISDGVQKIEPVMLHEELCNYKAGIITEVTPLSYDIRTDRWSYVINGYGVYNGELTPREIIRNYYLKGEH